MSVSLSVQLLYICLIFSWMSVVWNEMIAPTVRDAVIKGTGKDTSSEGQQKVANTALYVLMQKAVVPGCPLSGPGKYRYIITTRRTAEGSKHGIVRPDAEGRRTGMSPVWSR